MNQSFTKNNIDCFAELKTEGCYDVYFSSLHQWRQSWHHNNSRVSVWLSRILPATPCTEGPMVRNVFHELSSSWCERWHTDITVKIAKLLYCTRYQIYHSRPRVPHEITPFTQSPFRANLSADDFSLRGTRDMYFTTIKSHEDMKLRIHSQTSTVQPLKFENG